MKDEDDEEKLVVLAEDMGLTMEDGKLVSVMPVRQDIEVVSADKPSQRMLGWTVTEEIGIAMVNPRGIATGRKNSRHDGLLSGYKKTRLSDG